MEIERRAADDLEHVGGGGLLLQRFAEIVGTLPQLVEQAGVLDRDDGLIGEALDQRNLLVREGAHLLTIDGDDPDQFMVLEHRHGEKGPSAGLFGECDTDRIPFGVSLLGRDIRNVN